jgi:hypothetical protein
MVLAFLTIGVGALVREEIGSQPARLMNAKINRSMVFLKRHNHQVRWLWQPPRRSIQESSLVDDDLNVEVSLELALSY